MEADHPRDPPPNRWQRFARSRAPATLLGVAVLGLACTTLYDIVVKPGLSAGGRAFLSIATLGSLAAKDTAYENAALDPTPVTGLLIFAVCLSFFFALPMGLIVTSWNLEKRIGEDLEKPTKDEPPSARLDHLRGEIRSSLKNVRRYRYFAMALLAVLFPLSMLFFAIHSQSVAVWRVFHADLKAVRPYVTESETSQFVSRFSRVRSRADFVELHSEIKEIARQEGIALADASLW